MADQGMASIQFAQTQSPPPYSQHRMGIEIGREDTRESPVAISSNYLTSADAATAWRVRKQGTPLPYSKRTRASLYKFDQE